MIKHSALALLAALALPLSAHAQDGKAGTSARAASQDRPPAAQRDKDGTLNGTVKGTGTTSTPREDDKPGVGPGVSGADDARANMERTNSQAASSGAVDGRNALAPAGTPMGPSGAPAVGH